MFCSWLSLERRASQTIQKEGEGITMNSTGGSVGTSATTNAILVVVVILLFVVAVSFGTTKRKSLGDLFADLKR